jgi:hypothetical protein
LNTRTALALRVLFFACSCGRTVFGIGLFSKQAKEGSVMKKLSHEEFVFLWNTLECIARGARELRRGEEIILMHHETDSAAHRLESCVLTAVRTTYHFGIFPSTRETMLLVVYPYCLGEAAGERVLRFELFDKDLLAVLAQEVEGLRRALGLNEINIDRHC